MNCVEKWNKLDSIIYFFESKIGALRNLACNDEESEPDVEMMIQAETEHLRNENENLKKREIPVRLVEEGGMFFCPKCRNQLSDSDVKYCANCGHRVVKTRKIEEGNACVYDNVHVKCNGIESAD